MRGHILVRDGDQVVADRSTSNGQVIVQHKRGIVGGCEVSDPVYTIAGCSSSWIWTLGDGYMVSLEQNVLTQSRVAHRV